MERKIRRENGEERFEEEAQGIIGGKRSNKENWIGREVGGSR